MTDQDTYTATGTATVDVSEIRDTLDQHREEIDQLAEDDGTAVDYERLAEEVSARIDTDEGLTREDVEQIVDSALDDLDTGTETDLDVELAEIRRARRELELVGSPRHTRTVADGPHEDTGYHPYGAWGLVVTVEEDVHWREAAVHAESEGTMRLDVYTMDYEPNETYDVGDRLMTREINVSGGRQTVYPDVMLHRGQTYFITRDSTDPAGSDVVPLKRGATGVDWDDLNASDIPLTFECSWQLGRSGPGSQAFRDYRDAGWHRVMHHFRALEFGYNEEG